MKRMLSRLSAIGLLLTCTGCSNSAPEPTVVGATAQELTVSSAIAVDSSIEGPATGDFSTPQVASGAGTHFTVWLDQDRSIVVGARMDTSGNVLDANPLVLVDADEQPGAATIGFGGQQFLLAWFEKKSSSINGIGTMRVSRVDAAGQLMNPAGTALSPPGSYAWPQIVFDGTNFLVLWSEEVNPGTHRALARRVSPMGMPVDSAPVELASLSITSHAEVAFNGQAHLVTWESSGGADPEVVVQRFATDLTPLDATPTVLDSNFVGLFDPLVASNGSDWLVTWSGPSQKNVVVAADGTIGTERSSGAIGNVTGIGFGADTFVLKGSSGLAPNAKTAVQRLDSNGVPLGSTVDLSSTPVFGVETGIGFLNNEFVVAYQQGQISSNTVHAARIAPDGTNNGDSALSRSANSETLPEIAFDGSNYLVVWQDTRGEDIDVYAMLLDSAGQPTTSDAVPIASGPGNQALPSVAWTGTEYVVVWTDDATGDANIVAGRVTSTGSLIGNQTVVCAETGAQLAPRIASEGGGKSYVVWEDHRTSGFLRIYGARLSGADSVDGTGVLVAADVRDRYRPSVTYGNGQYLVVWSDERNFQSGANIFAARVGTDGIVVDASGIEVSQQAGAEHDPRVVWNGARYVVTWRRADGAAFYQELDSAGVPQGSASELLAGATAQSPAALAFDGTSTVMAWRHTDALRGITWDGTATDAPFDIAPSSDDAWTPTLASDGMGRSIVAYATPDAVTGARRLVVRTLSDDSVSPTGGSGGTGASGGSAGSATGAAGGVGGTSGAGVGGSGAGSGAANGSGANTGAGANGNSGSASDDGGCGCRTRRGGGGGQPLWWALGIAILGSRRRRA